MNAIQDGLNQFISIRMEHVASSMLATSPEYEDLIKNCNQLFSILHDCLPKEYIQALYDYETNTTLLQGMAESIMYEQGLKDGVCLNQMLLGE
ncbi:hypothetical protein NST83_07010 [Paenibacillus sp. FSL R10-2782]|uniref:hypothetical protein n=1 Tax=unclassified Paenibacillus TaxID=185978 RepID=UPI001787C11C|nr:hypothetical protein [Paenibacillus sp. 23TSA30-6]MBE0336956.1 hypothetical protein [Paenibacillus sp. 23TSA30-6]